MKVHQGDKVQVISGKDKGREGVVKQAWPKRGQVLVEGVGVVKKHAKPNSKQSQGGIIELTKPVPVARVMLICPQCNQPCRVGYRLEAGKKYRFCKKCQTVFKD